eukprot:TRINITY_DN21662_c0_g1_i1.p1 TRINITY_DN21662_c0_g1~~TRINITY_DN21662_c0_g1_i1.p1  ORF type:complete len:670 (+),score=142.94 TRINITY_DN21662_c0_g1_i1:79-2010(+)
MALHTPTHEPEDKPMSQLSTVLSPGRTTLPEVEARQLEELLYARHSSALSAPLARPRRLSSAASSREPQADSVVAGLIGGGSYRLLAADGHAARQRDLEEQQRKEREKDQWKVDALNLKALGVRHASTLVMPRSQLKANAQACSSFLQLFACCGQWRTWRLKLHAGRLRRAAVRIQTRVRAYAAFRAHALSSTLRMWQRMDRDDRDAALAAVRSAAKRHLIDLHRKELDQAEALQAVSSEERRVVLIALWRQRQELLVNTLREWRCMPAVHRDKLAKLAPMAQLARLAQLSSRRSGLRPTQLSTLLGPAAWRVSESTSNALGAPALWDNRAAAHLVRTRLMRPDSATLQDARVLLGVLRKAWGQLHVDDLRGAGRCSRQAGTAEDFRVCADPGLIGGWTLRWLSYVPPQAPIAGVCFTPGAADDSSPRDFFGGSESGSSLDASRCQSEVETPSGAGSDEFPQHNSELVAEVSRLLSRHSRPVTYWQLYRSANDAVLWKRAACAAALPRGGSGQVNSSAGSGLKAARRHSVGDSVARPPQTDAGKRYVRRASQPVIGTDEQVHMRLASTVTESWRRRRAGQMPPAGRRLPTGLETPAMQEALALAGGRTLASTVSPPPTHPQQPPPEHRRRSSSQAPVQVHVRP